MGLLSRMNEPQPWWMLDQAQQMQSAAPAPAPAPVPAHAQPAMQPAPQRLAMPNQQMTPATHSPLQAFNPQALSAGSVPQVQQPTFMDRLQQFASNPDNLEIGLHMMAAGQPGGGGWASFAPAYSQLQQRTHDRRRQQTTDQREAEQWSWMQQERERAGQRRQLAQEFISSRPPAEQAELRMIDPDQLGEYLQGQRQFELQQRGLDLQIEEMRNSNRFRGASLALDQRRLEQDRLLNSSEAMLGREEAARIGGWMSRLDNWRMVDNDLRALEEVWQRNPAAFDQILDSDQASVLARIRDPEMRRDVNTIYAVGANLAREELRGQTPVSNIDLLSAIRSNPNTASGSLFARSWLDRAYEDRRMLEGQVQSALAYRQGGEGGGPRALFTPDPQTGRNWYQTDAGYTRYTAGGLGGNQSPAAQSDDARQAAAALAARRARGGGESSPQSGRLIAPLVAESRMNPTQRSAYARYRNTVERNVNPEARRRAEEAARRVGVIP